MEVRQLQDTNRNGNLNPSHQAPQGQPQGQNSFNASPQQNNAPQTQQSNGQQQPPNDNNQQQQQPSNNNNQQQPQQPQQNSQQNSQQTNQQANSPQQNPQSNNNQPGSSNNNVSTQGSAQSGNGREGNQQAGGDQRGNSGGQSPSDGRDWPSDQSNDPNRQNQQSSNSDNHSGDRQGDGSRQDDHNGAGQGGSNNDRGRGDSREGSDDNRGGGDSRGSNDDQGREGSREGSNDDRDRNGSGSRENNGSQESNRGDRNFENGAGIEGGSKTAIIAGSAAGAVLILLLLGFVIWRRRRGASYSDIVRCRKHTSSVVLEQGGGDGKVIARPVYQQEHYAKNASQPDVLRNMSEPPPMGMNETSHRGSVVEANLWKSANPPLPSPEEPGAWPLADSSPTLISDSPTSASSPSRHLYRDRAQPPRYELSRSNTGLSLVRQQTDGMTSEEEDKLKSPHSPINTRGGRWSWTNSQAPSTPRAEVPNKRSSLTSFTSRNVPNWMSSRQNQLDKEVAAAAEKEKEKVKLGTAKSVPMLKNHAVRPILAPPPAVARKMSGRKVKEPHRRVGSLSMIFKPTSSGASSPQSPVSPAMLEEGHRLSTSTATVSPVVEMNPQSRWR